MGLEIKGHRVSLGSAQLVHSVDVESSAHGRYPPAGPVRAGSPLAAAGSSVGGIGAILGLHGLAAASTPAQRTVWKRGGGTLVAGSPVGRGWAQGRPLLLLARAQPPAGPSARTAQPASLLYSQAKTAPPMTPSTKPQTRPTNAPA